MQTAALFVIFAFAAWLAGAGVAALMRPALARGWIARFATSHAINVAEQAWRGLAGAAMVWRAPLSLAPEALRVIGWILLVSAAALLVIPLRWHSGYATWWSRKLPLPIVRIAGAAALALAAVLVRTAIG